MMRGDEQMIPNDLGTTQGDSGSIQQPSQNPRESKGMIHDDAPDHGPSERPGEAVSALNACVREAFAAPASAAKRAYAAGEDAVVALVRELVEPIAALRQSIEEQATALARATAEADQLADERGKLAVERRHLAAERDRLVEELRAAGVAGGDVPKSAGDLLAWRELRALSQEQAAARLGVGRATISRVERSGPDAPLGRALRAALARDAEAMRRSRGRAAHPHPHREGPRHDGPASRAP
jgi:hypothetical protein